MNLQIINDCARANPVLPTEEPTLVDANIKYDIRLRNQKTDLVSLTQY